MATIYELAERGIREIDQHLSFNFMSDDALDVLLYEVCDAIEEQLRDSGLGATKLQDEVDDAVQLLLKCREGDHDWRNLLIVAQARLRVVEDAFVGPITPVRRIG